MIDDANSSLLNKHPDSLFIVAGDFKQLNLKTALPKLHQHAPIPTRGKNTLDQVYMDIKDMYKDEPCLQFDLSNHNSVPDSKIQTAPEMG